MSLPLIGVRVLTPQRVAFQLNKAEAMPLSHRRSLTVGDWLSLGGRWSLAVDGTKLHNDLESSLDLLDNVLQLPKDKSPFNSLRALEQEPATNTEEKNGDESKNREEYAQVRAPKTDPALHVFIQAKQHVIVCVCVHVWREGGGERGGKRERWRERKEVETQETRYTS